MAMPSIACLGVIGKNNNPLHITIFPSHNPSTTSSTPKTAAAPLRTPLQFSLLLSSALDIFESRKARASTPSSSSGTSGTSGASASASGSGFGSGGGGGGGTAGVGGQGSLSGDLGLLQALDERLALYGFETNTGAKFVAVVDLRGRRLKGVVAGTGGGGKEGEDGGGVTGGGQGKGGKGGAGTAAAVGGLRDGELKIVFRAMQAAYVRLLQNPFYDPDEHSPAMGRGGKKITSRRFAADMQRIGESWMPGKTTL